KERLLLVKQQSPPLPSTMDPCFFIGFLLDGNEPDQYVLHVGVGASAALSAKLVVPSFFAIAVTYLNAWLTELGLLPPLPHAIMPSSMSARIQGPEPAPCAHCVDVPK